MRHGPRTVTFVIGRCSTSDAGTKTRLPVEGPHDDDAEVDVLDDTFDAVADLHLVAGTERMACLKEDAREEVLEDALCCEGEREAADPQRTEERTQSDVQRVQRVDESRDHDEDADASTDEARRDRRRFVAPHHLRDRPLHDAADHDRREEDQRRPYPILRAESLERFDHVVLGRDRATCAHGPPLLPHRCIRILLISISAAAGTAAASAE